MSNQITIARPYGANSKGPIMTVDFDQWAKSDPVVRAQRARADANDAAKRANRAKLVADHAERIARECSLEHYQIEARAAREEAGNRARFARHAEAQAKEAEARACKLMPPAKIAAPAVKPAAAAPVARACDRGPTGAQVLAANIARYEAQHGNAAKLQARTEAAAANYGWHKAVAAVNARNPKPRPHR